MTPYYQDETVTIYHGDARELLPSLAGGSLLTDPTWPNATVPLFGFDDPWRMLRQVLDAAPGTTRRLAIHLGCDSDPRFLSAVQQGRWKFFRACWLDMSRPHYKGRLLAGAEVAYLFGEPPASIPGTRVIPGMRRDHSPDGKYSGHPCPRKLGHAAFLVRWWSEPSDIVLDPFMGSGTTLRASKDIGRKAIGIEIEERYCEIAAKRMAQRTLFEADSSFFPSPDLKLQH